MDVVYCGPACFLPDDIRDAHSAEGAPDMHSGSSRKRGIKLVDVGQDCDTLAKVLLDLGFPAAAVQRAVQRRGDADTAFEWLISSEGKACVNAAFASEAAASKPSSPILGDAQAENTSSGSMSTALDITECSVCLEHMPISCAAMRCSGVGGSRHYFHAECLSSWIRQCQRESKGPPTCPECRGPVQIQRRRFEEFLAEKGTKRCVDGRLRSCSRAPTLTRALRRMRARAHTCLSARARAFLNDGARVRALAYVRHEGVVRHQTRRVQS